MELFDEILQCHHSGLTLVEKYNRLYTLLDRVCKEQTANYGVDFSNLFSRLYALCRQTGYRRTAIERFRLNARRIIRREVKPDTDTYAYDLKALCEAIAHFYATPIPQELAAILPATWRGQNDAPRKGEEIKAVRLVAEHWDEQYLYGYAEAWPTENLLKVNYAESHTFADLGQLLYAGAQLNLLSVTVDNEETLTPQLIVLEPDYLIDISSLAECFQNYGCSPLNYLVNKFRPKETTHHIMLGNAANQFLDDCVNEQPGSPATYERSMQKLFKNNLLEYTVCEGIDKDYFDKARTQFNYIHDAVKALFKSPTCRIDKDGALLEPSFISEKLGLQGRMDFLQGDYRNLIELKSGKAEGIGNHIRAKESHAMQMALYKEILYYNLDIPRDVTTTYLFYSQYPKMFAERSAKAQIQRAIQLRNQIVANEQTLKIDGGRNLIPSILPEGLNTYGIENKLWKAYQYPQLSRFLAPFHQENSLLLDYFYTFTAFVSREQFLSKMGDTQADSGHGFADTWNSDTPTKLSTGNILVDLEITAFDENEGIEKVHFAIPEYEEGFLPNFRPGDIVLLYERNGEQDNATNRQVIRGNLEELTTSSLTVGLRNKQRNPLIFHTESRYAIEHDFMDSSYGTLYKGLYALLTAPDERRDLLLATRKPRINVKRYLNHNYLNKQIDQIVLQAKQAEDYFLLVGPPGTGKTSVALKSMVEEFYSMPGTNLLLLSYTNRAVDEICEMLESICPTPPYVRIGSELACEKKFRPHLLKNFTDGCNRRSEVGQALEAIRIIVGTTASISGKPELFDLKDFDVAIIDEASQILEPQIMGLLCRQNRNGACSIRKFILIGDHKQLPAVVLQRPEDSAVTSSRLREIGLTNCRNSLFERLYTLQSLTPIQGVLGMLNRQGRMHPAVCDFANHHFYDGQLSIIPLEHQQTALEWKVFDTGSLLENFIATTRIGMIDVPYPPAEDSNKINRQEAWAAAQMVSHIYKLCEANHLHFDAPRRIGIIVPFRNQIAMIRHELALLQLPDTDEITIDTVERYQGSQRDIILYSTTISRLYQLDNLSVITKCNRTLIDRKLNVAITRARKQLFIIGNTHLLGQQPIYRALIKQIEEKGILLPFSSLHVPSDEIA